MLEKPSKLERLVSEVAAATALPMTVKIRTGQNASKINVHKVSLDLSLHFTPRDQMLQHLLC